MAYDPRRDYVEQEWLKEESPLRTSKQRGPKARSQTTASLTKRFDWSELWEKVWPARWLRK